MAVQAFSQLCYSNCLAHSLCSRIPWLSKGSWRRAVKVPSAPSHSRGRDTCHIHSLQSFPQDWSSPLTKKGTKLEEIGVQLIVSKWDVFLKLASLPSSVTLLPSLHTWEHLPVLCWQTSAWHQAVPALAIKPFPDCWDTSLCISLVMLPHTWKACFLDIPGTMYYAKLNYSKWEHILMALLTQH